MRAGVSADLSLSRLVQPAAFMAAGLAAAKLNVLPNAKGSAAAVVKSGCESDRNPDGPRRGAARDHDAALGAGSERQGPGREASGRVLRSSSGRRPVEPARAQGTAPAAPGFALLHLPQPGGGAQTGQEGAEGNF